MFKHLSNRAIIFCQMRKQRVLTGCIFQIQQGWMLSLQYVSQKLIAKAMNNCLLQQKVFTEPGGAITPSLCVKLYKKAVQV